MSEQHRSDLEQRVTALLEAHDPATTDRAEFLRARWEAGLAWVHFPAGLGGLGLPRDLQAHVDDLLAAAGAPDNAPERNGIGLGMAAPTILAHGTPEQHERFLRPLWLGEEIWCQLFSEPGAGSDLAAVATRAVPDESTGEWVVNGQKVWTSSAHLADFAILVARTDPDVPKHGGLSYFLLGMREPGVEVRPLRQLTGEAEFNEVFLTDVRVPAAQLLGAVGEGWRIANTTLNSERVSIGGQAVPREAGMVGKVAQTWRAHPERRTHGAHRRLLDLWVQAEAARITGSRVRQQLAVGAPGPEGSATKLVFARLAQELSALEVELLGEDGLRYDDWTLSRPEKVDFTGRDAGYRYLRAKGNSIEGGTSEILRNIIAERVLGLPGEPRVDKDVAWKDLPR
ncbi:alkylation response protein AidB-like acyl-CoA dehydrogenase [Nocardioides salarius]|uniref:Alkylation response protein AidB-like acyl-CoA dehydrogenase n=1 Tax=Nocardioides salarius TaxID=374513 RepID=A0ABS2MD00_9ACTN|nr:acyl-CoA dehydrogenase family protein [Nocardioides salarius]MBM7509081.1 alkylation response protein AidB-like acyl-CoA dehydrogenase [Nocardioides salarius]